MAKSKRKERVKEKDRDNERKAKKRRREDDNGVSSVAARSSSKHSEDADAGRTKRHKHSSRRDKEEDSHKHRRKKGTSKKDMVEKKKSKKKDSRERRKEDHNRKHRRDDDGVEQLKDQGTSAAVEGVVEISKKDYFTRVKEFKVWLLVKRKTYFEELSSAESHELFDKFVRDWNRGKLNAEFYEDRLPEELVACTKKTRHKWEFVDKLSDRDQMQLASTNDSVQSSTEKVEGVRRNVPVVPAGSAKSSKMSSMAPPPPRARTGEGRGRENDDDDGEQRRRERKRQRKLEMEKHAVVLDEIAPKETGRHAAQDKRREVGTRTHAAAKEREQNTDGLDMKEADIMGGGDSFQDALKRSQGAKQRRHAAQQELLREIATKEEAKRAALMAQLGLKPGQKITIQPRRDG